MPNQPMTPAKLRELAAKYFPSKVLGTLMPKLQADLDAAAAAWEVEHNQVGWLLDANSALAEKLNNMRARLREMVDEWED